MTPLALSTPRLLPRGFTPNDLDALAAIYADSEVMRTIRGGARSRRTPARGACWKSSG